MSHEIRTPMNAILGFSELLLLDKNFQGISLQNIQNIHDSAESLLSIINDILDISKLESGHLELEDICFKLREPINETFLIFSQLAEDKSLNLELDIDTNVPECVTGDPTRLRQVLINLVSNALKFTHQGSVTVNCKTSDRPGFIDFSVSDTGIGMTPVQRKRIFELFSQADSSTSRLYGGTGLGTSISKNIVELMGGHISVVSESNKGSRFFFSIPLPEKKCPETDCFEDGQSSTSAPESQASQTSIEVLLAEDNAFNQALISQQFSLLGYQTRVAENGQLALDLWERGNFKLIACDINMPVMDGYELVSRIREQEKMTGKHIPIIAMTANAMAGEEEKCLNHGFDDYFSKPVDIENLKSLLGKWG